MVFYVASDHGGFQLKEKIKKYLLAKNIEVRDLGSDSDHVPVSYAKQGHLLATSVLAAPNPKDVYGVGVCGTGLGISCALNRHKKIRAARIVSEEDAHLAKAHNNANVIVFGGRQVSFAKARKMIDTFLTTKYEGGRHQARINAIDE